MHRYSQHSCRAWTRLIGAHICVTNRSARSNKKIIYFSNSVWGKLIHLSVFTFRPFHFCPYAFFWQRFFAAALFSVLVVRIEWLLQSVHHFSPDWNIAATFWWVAMKFTIPREWMRITLMITWSFPCWVYICGLSKMSHWIALDVGVPLGINCKNFNGTIIFPKYITFYVFQIFNYPQNIIISLSSILCFLLICKLERQAVPAKHQRVSIDFLITLECWC